jgi:hypothetical protein
LTPAARGKRFDMGKAGGGIGDRTAGIGAGRHERRVGRINRNVHLRTYAFDDPRINLPVEGLRPAIVIGMGVNDGGAGARARDAFGDDGLDRIWNARLQRAAPGTVQRRLDPDLAHGAVSFFGFT